MTAPVAAGGGHKRAHTVLLLGASNLTYSEAGREGSVAGILESRLNELSDEASWDCQVRGLFYGPRMAEIAARHCEVLHPQAIYLSLLGNPLMDDAPLAAIRRRWPALYPRARRIADRLKSAAGGHHVPGLRGSLYRFPRWLAGVLAGSAPEVDVQDAIHWTREVLSLLARLEDTMVVCGFSAHLLEEDLAPPSVRDRLAGFQSTLRETCDAHRIPLYDRQIELSRAGVVNARGKDEAYAGPTTRRFDADRIAHMILSAQL